MSKEIASSTTVDASAVWELFERATECAIEAGHQGLFLIIDELGKFLEYAALHPSEDDLFILQYLAEGAARSPGRMVLITIQHSPFADYLGSGNHVQVLEWQKIQGRFTDVAFYLPSEQMLALLGASLDARWPQALAKHYGDILDETLMSPALSEARSRAPVDQQLPHCLPFNPICALLLWPLFRAKMSQNERSLFAFLSSQEPFGLQEFLKSATWGEDDSEERRPPLYQVDRLYD